MHHNYEDHCYKLLQDHALTAIAAILYRYNKFYPSYDLEIIFSTAAPVLPHLHSMRTCLAILKNFPRTLLQLLVLMDEKHFRSPRLVETEQALVLPMPVLFFLIFFLLKRILS